AFIDQYEKNLSFYGNPGMYRFNPQTFFASLTCTSVYDTCFLEKTFHDYIDPEKLNQPDKSRLIATAINVRTGDQKLFDNGSMALDFRHIMASGSFPVTFPMTEIDDEIYWDGGIFINTPAAPAINALEMIDTDNPDVERELIYIEVHRREGEIPTNLRDSIEKCYALIFSGKFSLDGKLAKKLNNLMDFFDEMERILPEDHPLRKHEVYKNIRMHRRLKRHITIGQSGRGATGSSHDFSRSTIERRIEDGFNDAMEILTKTND
ncbi:MAG: patatin-like phospholipase family protein, partial [Smithella sp.]